MGLFKILRGDSSRISKEVTPFHDGWAYFTPDDGGLYIDSENDDGSQERIRVKAEGGKSTPLHGVLRADAWENKQQTVHIEGLPSECNGLAGLSSDITGAQMEAARDAELYLCGYTANELTIAAYSITPLIDIPVSVILWD